jgi:hypothetical protein
LFELPKFIKIPRHLGFRFNTEIQLHVFVDASTKVFVATVYARILEMRNPKDLDKGVTARGGKSESLYCSNNYYGKSQSLLAAFS